MNIDFRGFLERLRLPEPAPTWDVRFALQMALVYLVARIAGLLFVSTLVDPTAVQAGAISPLVLNGAWLLAGAAVLVVAVLALQRRTGDQLWTALRMQPGELSPLLLLLFALGAAILIDFVPLIFGQIGLPLNLIGLGQASQTIWLVALVYTLLVGPLVEGVLFQGVLYPALAVRLGDNVRAVLVTGLAYTVLQVIDAPTDFVLWLSAFLTGTFLAGVRAHQQSTRAAILAGFAFGAFALFKALRLFL